MSQLDETSGDSRQPGRIGRTRARVKTAVDRGQRRLQEYRTRYWLVDFLFGFTERDRDVAGSVISSALAFRFFLVLVPFIVVIVAVISAFTDLSSISPETAVDAMGVAGFAADAVAGASRMTGGQIWLSLILGLFALLWASHWTTTSLRTVHALAWGMTIRRWPRPFLASLVFMGFLVAFVMVAAGFNIGSGEEGWFFDVLGTLLSGAAMGGLWMAVSWLLPHPDVGWRDLLPGAVLVAVGVQCLQIATFYFTWRIKGSSSLYGALGIAIVLLVWLYFASRLVVAAAMLNERVRFRRTGERAGHTLLGYVPAGAPPDKTDAHRLLLADMAQGGNDMAEDQSQTPDQASG
ncbi:MAG: YihY/virulence factor BrkB family protein, partial [Actinobacteria bacterium]|nr:YihY/virulence factor BrkB family protein [Actinomycetota bacterium]